jgi:hypothetical protein
MKTNDRKQKIIQKIKRINFRQEIEKTIDIFKSLWRLTKWVKDKSHLLREIFKMLTLKSNDRTIDIFEKKIDMFKRIFFSTSSLIDLIDISKLFYFQFDRVFLEHYEDESFHDHQAIRSR